MDPIRVVANKVATEPLINSGYVCHQFERFMVAIMTG
jgi:hypothetical protein